MNALTKMLTTCTISIAVGTAVHAQDMSAADRALLEQMMRNAGVDPAQVKAAAAQAQAAQRFGDVVRYNIVGVYQGRTNVSADQNWLAYADVSDRVEMQLDWKISEAKLVSIASLQNGKATLANPRNPEAKCAPPIVSGPFEYDLKSIEQGIGANLRVHIQTSFPSVQVHQFCTGALKSIAAKQAQVIEELFVPPPTMLSMPLPPDGAVTLSSDRKSLVHKKGGWTWTFTPRTQ